MSDKSSTISADKEPGADSGTDPRVSADHEAPDEVQNVAEAGEPKASRSISIRTLAFSMLATGAVVAIGVLAWLLHSESSANTALQATARSHERAEEAALDYATGAAAMDFKDLGAWRERLTKGTSEELAGRLSKASESMEQIITPLQWTSTSSPIAAKVESESGGVYEVLAFVGVTTKNVQAPEGVESTATYRMTLDGNKDWLISEISGIGSALGPGSQPK